MSVSSLNNTLVAFAADEISADTLANPLSSVVDILLNVVTLGLYGAYRFSEAKTMKQDLLDLGFALLKHDPARPDLPVKLKLNGVEVQVRNLPGGGIRVTDSLSGRSQDIDNIELGRLTEMIFLDLMRHDDFYAAMERRVFEATSVRLDLPQLKQERANACGDACAAMLLAYHGIDHAPATNDRFILEGLETGDIEYKMALRGMKAMCIAPSECHRYTSQDIEKGIEHGPLLCELDGHFVVLNGINAALDRIDLYCPLLGSRSASLQDFNAHLNWGGGVDVPLNGFIREGGDKRLAEAFGMTLDPDFSPTLVDRLGVAVLKQAYCFGNDWLKPPAIQAGKY